MSIPILTQGIKSTGAGTWQRFLHLDGEDVGTIDEDFGPKTEAATLSWQRDHNLFPTGRVDDATRVCAMRSGYVPFVSARGQTILWPSTRNVTLIVVHTMENPEKPKEAMNVALWFAGLTAYVPPVASAHYCVDDQETWQCVRETDVAWHAPGANSCGIGIEHAGYAAQTAKDWTDAYSLAVLEQSAQLSADIARRWNILPVRLTPADLRAGKRNGFCGHVDVTDGLNGGKGHQDPGLFFPWTTYLERVKELMS
jgi:hypothetical protein